MRALDRIRDCAAYILRDSEGQYVHHGTAFFVSVQSETNELRRHTYLVTAKHLLIQPMLALSVNAKNGTRHDPFRLPNASQWWCPDDDGVDVAALPVDAVTGWTAEIDYEPVPIENTFNDDMIEELNVGIGDELLITGLLVNHPGTIRNIPVVRSGIIAAMAGDELRDTMKDGSLSVPYRAHLVELRSTGGLSGSPVFVVLGPARPVTMASSTTWDAAGGIGQASWRLLGLIRGHWAQKLAGRGGAGDGLYDSDQEGLNRGIAKVVPSQYIRRLLLSASRAKGQRLDRDRDAK